MDAEELGRLGKDVLNNAAFIQAFENIQSKLIEAWTQATPGDTVLKESAWASMKLLEKVKWELEYFMEDGNIEKLNRVDDQEKKQKVKDYEDRKKKYLETPLPGTRLVKKTE